MYQMRNITILGVQKYRVTLLTAAPQSSVTMVAHAFGCLIQIALCRGRWKVRIASYRLQPQFKAAAPQTMVGHGAQRTLRIRAISDGALGRVCG